MSLGSLLRRRRKEKGLTLRSVAEKAGVSEGFLSQVENDVKSPSLDTLMSICSALEADAGEIFRRLQSQERLFLVRRSEWSEVDLPHTGFATRRFVHPENRSVIDSAVLFLEPGRSLPVRKNVKNGQEILCVLEGSLHLVHGDQEITLGQGDAAHVFTDPEKQSITNRGRKRAVVLWVGTI
ncbi:MAG: XRE family transcriptional regulator [Thermodesulfobacteriota bacterium]